MACQDRWLVLVGSLDDYSRNSVDEFSESVRAVALKIFGVERLDLAEICSLGRGLSEYAGRSCVSVLNIWTCLSVEVEHFVPTEYVILYPVVGKLLEYYSADADLFGDLVYVDPGCFFLEHYLFCLLDCGVKNVFEEYDSALTCRHHLDIVSVGEAYKAKWHVDAILLPLVTHKLEYFLPLLEVEILLRSNYVNALIEVVSLFSVNGSSDISGYI